MTLDYSVRIRGNVGTDPDAVDFVEVIVQCAGLLPIVTLFGDVEQDGNGTLIGRIDSRLKFLLKIAPATVKVNADPKLQDYGTIWKLLRYVLKPPPTVSADNWSIWIMDYYLIGSDPGSGQVPRARMQSGGVTDDLFHTAELPFPIRCILDGDATPQPNFDNGTVDLDFTLVSAEVE